MKSYTDDSAYDLLRQLELRVLADNLKKETVIETKKTVTDGKAKYHNCLEKVTHFKNYAGHIIYKVKQHIDIVEDYYRIYIDEFEKEYL